MLFSINTDLAIRLLIYLAAQPTGRFVTLAELAAALDHKLRPLRLLTPRLVRYGLIESACGPAGGLRLARAAGCISISEIVQIGKQIMGQEFSATDRKVGTTCVVSSNAPQLDAMYDKAQAAIIDIFSTITIKELCNSEVTLAAANFSARWDEVREADRAVWRRGFM